MQIKEEKEQEEKREKVVEERGKNGKEKGRRDQRIGENWQIVNWTFRYIEENSEVWRKDLEEQEKDVVKELEEWKRLKRKEKISMLQEKWKGVTKEGKENDRTELKVWRRREKENGGEGSPAGAFPFKNEVPTVSVKAPSVNFPEGDPPIGKERGTLGVGTGLPSPKKTT